MSDRSDDTPLSSEEMIRAARQDLGRPAWQAEASVRAADGIELEEEIDFTAAAPVPTRRSSTQSRARRQRSRAVPRGFGEPTPSNQRAAMIAGVLVALLGLGIAVLVAFASSTP